MQPYQSASEEVVRQQELPGKALGSIAKTAIGLAGGGAILNRVMPFLNKYIDPDLAVKGLNKIDPRFGKFVSGALGQGMSIEDIGSFIKEKATGEKSQEESKKPQQQQNLIEEHAPEVYEILKDRIGQGLKPLAAAYQIAKEGKFSKQIADLQKKAGTGFGALVTSIFGGEENQQVQSQQSKMPQAQEQPQDQSQQQQASQQGQGTQNLMAALQAAAQSRARRQQK